MYLKLALRNAKRSISNYLLYITSMTILVSIMMVSNSIAETGKIHGFQTASLPFLITLILVILAGHINRFMLKERAKEFANYLLLGMEKSKLSWMFLAEFWVIGMVCFLIGSLIGSGIYITLCLFQNAEIQLIFLIQSLTQTFFYFCLVEFLSTFWVKRDIDKLEIRELMIEKKRNCRLGDKRHAWLWGVLFAVSLSCMVGLLLGIAYLPDDAGNMFISVIAIPLIASVFSFYKWIYQFLSIYRQTQSPSLYRRDRLYMIAQITSGTSSNAVISSVFCICLIFSAMSFVTGLFMLQPGLSILDAETQQWMGFLQICICIIFIVIYFSILSMQQIIEFKQGTKDIQILHYIGKDRFQIKSLIRKCVLIRLSLPTVMCAIPLLIAMPLLNAKLNTQLPETMQHIAVKSVGLFFACFLMLYVCYYFVVRAMCKRYVKSAVDCKA